MYQKSLFYLLFTGILLSCYSQDKKLKIEIQYGPQGNFGVRDYEERIIPGISYAFYEKRFVGTIGGIELKYSLGKKLNVGIGYNRSINKRRINFAPDNIPIYIEDFTIRHFNDFYQLVLERTFTKKKSNFNISTGLFYYRSALQEIDASIYSLGLEERNFKNSGAEQGGAFVGLQFETKIDSHFYLGIKSRFYYAISLGYPEAITLTPSLTYKF